jgi:hypothetical protein
MNWMLIAAILVAGTLSTFTDWLFMGVLFHDRYQKYPETWWPRSGPGAERGAIIWSSALGYVTAAAIVLLCAFAGVSSIGGGLTVAALAAAAGPLVISPTNGFWVKIDPAVTFAHTAGYIVRFLIAGLAAGYVLS